MLKKKNRKKDYIWNTLGTTINAFNSLFFLIIVTRINGVNNAGIFSLAFSIGNLLFILGVYCGRVFQVTDNDKSNDDFSYFNLHIITAIMMLLIAVLFSVIRGYPQVKLLAIIGLVVAKALEAIADSFHAVIQKNDELFKVGISLTIRSVLNLLLFTIVAVITYLVSSLIIIDNNYLRLVINSLIGLFIPSIILILLFYKTDNFKYYISLLKNILRGSKVDNYGN